MAMYGVDDATTVADRYLENTEVIDGVRYTTQEDQNKLSNDDFLTLLLEEMKMQDPTKPMDSARMMDSQLQMSTIETNMAMSEAMASLQSSYANSALSTAAGLIGSVVENSEVDDEDRQKSFKVQNVENRDGVMYLNARELTGYEDAIAFVDGETKTAIAYNTDGYLYDTDGNITDIKVRLGEDGRFDLDEDGELVLYDADNEVITDEATLAEYSYTGAYMTYASEVSTMLMSDITKVSG